MSSPDKNFLIGVVGPCGSGKSTLIAGLEKNGYRCRHIAQEHSYVKQMWQVITHPDLLIFLQSSFQASTSRRKLNWNLSDYEEQQRRLSHAYEHARLIIDTAELTAEEVLACALHYLKENGL
jgi:cytidylate kinase